MLSCDDAVMRFQRVSKMTVISVNTPGEIFGLFQLTVISVNTSGEIFGLFQLTVISVTTSGEIFDLFQLTVISANTEEDTMHTIALRQDSKVIYFLRIHTVY